MATGKRAGEFCKVGENLYRYLSNKRYYAVFRSHGKLFWRSLRTSDRKLAQSSPGWLSDLNVRGNGEREGPRPNNQEPAKAFTSELNRDERVISAETNEAR